MTSLRRALILVVLLVPGLAAPARADAPDRLPRIRPLDAGLRKLLVSGVRNSPAFRALVDRINASDVVVYIRCTGRLRPGRKGQMTFVGAAAGLRYVVVALDPDTVLERMIATLGHELRHVVEVADTASIVDAKTLGLAYERIGVRVGNRFEGTFDTTDAVDAGAEVWRELVGGARSRGE